MLRCEIGTRSWLASVSYPSEPWFGVRCRLPFRPRASKVECVRDFRERETAAREVTMRSRALVVIALLALSSEMTAQRARPPRTGRGTTPPPAALPPEAGPVSRALAYKRSRWSAEAYSLITSFQLPAVGGGVSRYLTPGAGTRADYRYTEHWSATADITASLPGAPTTAETAEVGTRFSPLPWDRELRPFLDIRAAYMRMYDAFSTQTVGSIVAGAPSQQFVEGTRYSRGMGSVAG